MNKAGWHGAGRTVGPCGGCTFPARRSWVVATMATLVSCPRGHVQQAQGWLVRGPAGGVRQGQPEAGAQRGLCLCRGPCPLAGLLSPPWGQPGGHSQTRPRGWRVAGASWKSKACASPADADLVEAVSTSFTGVKGVAFLLPNGEDPRGAWVDRSGYGGHEKGHSLFINKNIKLPEIVYTAQTWHRNKIKQSCQKQSKPNNRKQPREK